MANYILRRDGRDYQAPDIDSLRQWASDGRVLPTDMVYSPRYQSWYRARDLRELRDVLPQSEPAAAPPPVARPPQQFWVRKGDRNYVADSLQTVLEWASNGNISPDDLIYHPTYSKWFRAGDSPQLASRFPPHIMGARLPFIPPNEDPLGSQEFVPSGAERARTGGSSLSTAARRRSVLPQRRSRTGPVLIGNRKAGAGRRSTSSGPFVVGSGGGHNIESADSTTKTMTDFDAGEIARAIQKRRESGAVSGMVAGGPAGSTEQPVEDRVTDPYTAVDSGDGERGTLAYPSLEHGAHPAISTDLTSLEPAPAPKLEPKPAPAPKLEPKAAPAPKLEPKAAPEPEPEPAPEPEPEVEEVAAAPEPEPAVEAEPEPASEPATVETPMPTAESGDSAPSSLGLDPFYDTLDDDYDDEAQLVDRLKLFKPFYAVARVFLVTKDMRPGETLEAAARLPGGQDFVGEEKRPIYLAIRSYMVDHLNGPVLAKRSLISGEEQAGFLHFLNAAVDLVRVLEGAEHIIGTRPPERFVVGNRNRPKMTPAEEEMILSFDAALKALISVKVKSAAA